MLNRICPFICGLVLRSLQYILQMCGVLLLLLILMCLFICLPNRMSTYGRKDYSYSSLILCDLHRIWHTVGVHYIGQIVI